MILGATLFSLALLSVSRDGYAKVTDPGYKNSSFVTIVAHGDNRSDRVFEPGNIVVNSPLTFLGEEYYLEPGEHFFFQVEFSAISCTNSRQNVSVYTLGKQTWFNGIPASLASLQGKSWDKSDLDIVKIFGAFINAWGKHDHVSRNFKPAGQGGYVAPSEPGTYPFYFYMYNAVSYGPKGYVLASIPITVGAASDECDPTIEDCDDECDPTIEDCDTDHDYSVGECGPNKDIIFSVAPTSPSGYCSKGEFRGSAEIDELNKLTWVCYGEDGSNDGDKKINGDDVSCWTVIKDGPTHQSDISNERMEPNIVEEDDTCVFKWTVEDIDGASGICQVYNNITGEKYGEELSYPAGGADMYLEVNPKRDYYVICRNPAGSDKSEIRRCSAKAVIIEN